MIDVIIPTLLLTDKVIFDYTLKQMIDCDVINKIIILDNTDDRRFKDDYSEFFSSNKLTLIENGENIFVNPAWNLGLSLVESEYFVILNDDVLCHKSIFEICDNKMKEDPAVGLLTVNTLQSQGIDYYENHIAQTSGNTPTFSPNIFRNRVGWFMCGRKDQWVDIPTSIKVFYGDDFIYALARHHKRKVLSLESQSIVHFESTSVNNKEIFAPIIHGIIQEDARQWPAIQNGVRSGRYNKPS